MKSRTRRTGLAAAAITIGLTGLVAVPPAEASPQGLFERAATYPVLENRPAGTPAEDATVAEISAVSEDGRTLVYTDAAAGRLGFLDISDPGRPQGRGTFPLADGEEPTSVAVAGPYVLAVIDTSESHTDPSGRLDVIRLADRTRVRSLELGGQPDSIALSKDGRYAAIAIENERDEDAGDGGLPQAPGGFLQILDLTGGDPAGWRLRKVPFTAADGTALPAFAQAGLDTPADPEPEYVAINDAGKVAVTLQENNGVAVVDLRTGKVERVFSTGRVTVTGIDTDENGTVELTGSIKDVPREPDAVAWIDDHTLATANEGDWKGGSRGWTVFSDTGRVLWDAGNTFEHLAVRYGHHNEDRTGNKGTEPEGLAVATYQGRRYAFVGSERANFVAVYDVSRPSKPRFVQFLPTNAGPEGLLPVPSRGLFIVSSEEDDADIGLRAGVQVFRLGKPNVPGLVAREPIGWGALSSLSPVPGDRHGLYAVSDSFYAPTKIYRINTQASPATITKALTVTKGGAPAAYDAEGIIARPHGGFWLASEGDASQTGTLYERNLLVRLDKQGAVQQEIPLPDDIAARVGKQGLEGVAVTGAGAHEQVWVTLQRPLPGDPADVVRLGRYSVATGAWAWFGYELEPSASSGNWNGLSELIVTGDRLAVVERDKAAGPSAAHKKIYSIPLPTGTPAAGTLPVLPKRLDRDLLPDLRGFGGHVQEKVEGLAVAGDGRVWIVTDNDGVNDATGETVFSSPGTARHLFGH
ncbi:Esterase-like activity of phytase [Thermomonospora echinospora]|uniref:Esterase-like activity of phytase n=1 Tax=Thermomonospora echinospora TaxID=1992 RepID=A0A1H6DWW2_9ACTN|nr:esterase-like activity of phytase family protein [Thermomonospora echinospora]SEG89761.1 Esterase-like activity of phytase [Thermomonospora echinospora]